MRLVHIEPVYAELLKGHNVVLAGGVVQLLQLGLQIFLGTLQLLDGKALGAAGLELRNAVLDLPDLLLQEPFLPLSGYGDALKLAVADDNGVIVAGGDAGAELLAVACLKVLFGSDKDIGGGVEPQELRGPLLRQVVRHGKEGFLAQAEALSLHGCGDHFKGLARAHLMGKERIAAVEVVGDGIELMLPQGDLRIHARKDQVPAIILPGTGGIEALVVELHQLPPPVGVAPDPVTERLFNGLLLLLGEGGFLAVEYALFLSVRVPYGVVDAHVPQVQRIFKDFVGVGAVGAVGHAGVDVVVGDAVLAGDVPLRRELRVVDLQGAAGVQRRLQQLEHELLNVLLVDPRRAEAHLDLRSVKVFRLCGAQCLHVGQIAGAVNGGVLRLPQLLPDVAGEVFVRCLPVTVNRVEENDAVQLVDDVVLTLAGELGHIRHIHAGFFPNGQGEGFCGGVHAGDGLPLPDGALGEHIRLALEFGFVLIVQHLKGAEQIIGAVVCKGEGVAPAVDEAVFLGEAVIEAVELLLFGADGNIVGFPHLKVDEPVNAVPQLCHALDALLCGGVQAGLDHDGVLTVVHLAVHHGIAVILHAGVCRNGILYGFVLTEVRQLCGFVLAADILNGVSELRGKGQILIRFHSKVLSAVLRTLRGLSA